jgi:hypothetical protein
MTKKRIIYLSPEQITPYDNNPRKNERAVPYVMESIQKFGFKVPIIIDKDNIIVTGHTRHKAAIKLGLKEIPCIKADDLTPEQVKAFRLADNKTGEFATWDTDKLLEELGDLEALNFDLETIGFETLATDIDAFFAPFEMQEAAASGQSRSVEQSEAPEQPQNKAVINQEQTVITCPHCGKEIEIK